MCLRADYKKTIAILLAMICLAGPTAAQQDAEATITIANSTDATLTVSMAVMDTARWANRVTIPPLTEMILEVPAGLLMMNIDANRASPAIGYTVDIPLSNGSRFFYNIPPSLFGVSHLSDRPKSEGTGVSTNVALQAINGAEACSLSGWKSGRVWETRTLSSTSLYYENGEYLCYQEGNFFYIKGKPYMAFDCDSGFKNCRRNEKWDAEAKNQSENGLGKTQYDFVWLDGSKPAVLVEQ